MKLSFVGVLALWGALTMLPVGMAKADTVAVNSVTGGSLATSGSDQLYGWIFDVNTAIDVTALGVYGPNSSLTVSHDVGIYLQSTEALVTSSTVPAGSCGSTADGFCFTSLGSPVLLDPGTYVIVMTMPQENTDYQLIQVNTPINTASEITYVNSAFDAGSSLAFPAAAGPFAPGIFGPNFEFNDESASVPEPFSLLMLETVLAAAAIAIALRRKFVSPMTLGTRSRPT